MARTESAMVQLGTLAPAFELSDVVSGKALSRDDVFALPGTRFLSEVASTRATHGGSQQKHGLLVMFVCPHCPYVQHVEEELGRLGRDYFGAEGGGPIAMAAIQSNDIAQYPEDGPEGMRAQAQRCGWTFPYLLDDTQEVARSYGAACTPDFFLFDKESRLVYRGQLDGSRPRRGDFGNDEPVTGRDLRSALEAVVQGKQPDPNQRGSIGCNIKWRAAAHP